MESPEAVISGLRMAGALSRFWEVRSHLNQARERYAELLALPGAAARTLIRAKALAGAGRLAWCQDDNVVAHAYFTDALSIFRELGSKRLIALTLAYLAFVERSQGDMQNARAFFEECLQFSKELGDEQLMAIGQSGQGTLAADDGDLQLARELKEKSLTIYRKIGDIYIISMLSWSLSRVVTALGDYSTARMLLEDCVTTSRQLGNKWIMPYFLEGFGDVLIGEGNAKRAAKLYGSAEVLREKIGLSMPPTDRIYYDRAVRSMSDALSHDVFQESWATGRDMKVEQALACALGKP